MNQISSNSSFHELNSHFRSLNFESFRFQISNDEDINQVISFVNFCSSLSANLISEVKTKVIVPDSNFRASEFKLNWSSASSSDLTTFHFRLCLFDNIKDICIKNESFLLAWYKQTSTRKKDFVSLYHSYRATNLINKFFLPEKDLEAKIISAVVQTMLK